MVGWRSAGRMVERLRVRIPVFTVTFLLSPEAFLGVLDSVSSVLEEMQFIYIYIPFYRSLH